MYFLSALYTLQYVPIVNYSCKLLYSKKNKKKKKKKRKKTRTSVWVKIPKLCHKKTPLSIFSLGKGRESLRLQTLQKKLSKKCIFCPAPQQAKTILIQTLCGRCTPKLTKIDQIKFTLPQLSHLSSNRRVRNLPLYFQFTTPARELTHRKKFVQPRKTRISEMPCFFAT